MLINSLNKRTLDQSEIVLLDGGHLTPASAGITKSLLGNLVNTNRTNELERLIDIIYKWSSIA